MPPENIWEDPRTVLRRHGQRPKKEWSQNFLVDRNVVSKIATAALQGAPDLVIELGPGAGTLTAFLLEHPGTVVGVERDPAMVAVLEAEFGARLTVLMADAAHVDLAELGKNSRTPPTVVGNLPYAATGAILRNLMAHSTAIASAVIMVQREVAQRMVAPAGSKTYGGLSVFLRERFTLRRLFDVSPGSFHPPPKVKSSVVRLVPHQSPLAAAAPNFAAVVRSAFSQRRKMLRNSLSVLQPDDLEARLVRAGVKPTARPEELELEAFIRIATQLVS